jgi:hypothetical protein
MEIAVAVLVILVTAGGGLFVLGLFVWGAKKDGEDQAARDKEFDRTTRPS